MHTLQKEEGDNGVDCTYKGINPTMMDDVFEILKGDDLVALAQIGQTKNYLGWFTSMGTPFQYIRVQTTG